MRRTGTWIGLAAVGIFVLAGSPGVAQTFEQGREQELAKLELDQMPDREDIARQAVELFAMPIEEQSEQALADLAKAASATARLIGFLYEEYDEHRQDNARYDVVTEKVDVVMDDYGAEVDKFKAIRNRAYFNLGVKAKAAGQDVMAFLYFRDAYRLSRFDCGTGSVGACMRWQAEKEMQKLLGLGHIQSYITWQ